MEAIGSVLSKKKIIRKDISVHRGHRAYGPAVSLQRDLGLPLPVCFRILKAYDLELIRQLLSWWRDYPFKKQNNIGLLFWKLKKLKEESLQVKPF